MRNHTSTKKNPISTTSYWLAIQTLAVAAAILPVNSFGAQKFDLSSPSPERVVQRVKVNLTVDGKLNVKEEREKGEVVRSLPLKVTGEVLYDERMLSKDQFFRSARYYHQASAAVEVADEKLAPKLSDTHRLIVFDQSESGRSLFSPIDPLAREELDLIDILGSGILAYGLLPPASVSISEKWNPATNALASFLNLDMISQTDVECKLASIEGKIAVIEMSGAITGAVDGVATEIELKAKYHFGLDDHRFSGFAIAMKEKRSIGHALPGFDVVVQLRTSLQPINGSIHLDSKTFANQSLEPNPENKLLRHTWGNGIQMLLDRKWQVIAERPQVTILRFVDRGDLVAQCNMSKLTNLPAGQHLSLEKFQADVKQSLGENFGQLAEASQVTLDNGNRILRVVATGIVSDVPIQWDYYHVANDLGQRVSLAFTLEDKLADRFAAAGSKLVSSLEFLPDQSPTPADGQENAPTQKPADDASLRSR